jgi:hypothetical protein
VSGAQSGTPEPVPDLNTKFEQFIETYRAPEKKPQMRNDDSTLVLCLPLHQPTNDQEQQVRDIIGKHQARAAQQVRIAHAAGTPGQSD